MSAALPLRDDFDGPSLRALAKCSRDPVHVRRLLALAEICDGGTRSAAARIGGVSLQSIRDWVLRFNAGGSDALIDANNAGRKPKLGASELQALVRAIVIFNTSMPFRRRPNSSATSGISKAVQAPAAWIYIKRCPVFYETH